MVFAAGAPLPAYGQGEGTVVLVTVLQPSVEPPPAAQSPKLPRKSRVPLVSPPEPTHSNTRRLVTAPPLLKVPRIRMSPRTPLAGAVWVPLKLPVAVLQPIWSWKNQ